MKIHSLIFLGLIIPAIVIGQSTLETTVSNSVCKCVSTKANPDLEEFIQCLEQAMVENEDLIINEAKRITNDTTEATGYAFGRELYNRISVIMVFTCDPYYKMMESLRNAPFTTANKDSIKRAISEINKIGVAKRGKDFFTNRGMMYFQIADTDSAINDFNNAIAIDKQALGCIFFKAWSLEIKKQYDKAIVLYDELAELTQKNEFKLFSAIAKRKRGSK